MTYYIVMGVSGCGKSTIGRALAARLNIPFIEGDDYHPQFNIDKMAAGQPLSNNDRKGWITALCGAANATGPSVMACSALNETVRNWLRAELKTAPKFIYLDGRQDMIAARLAKRSGHFFDPALLASQFAALDVPEDAIRICIDQAPKDMTAAIIAALDKK